jgi:hypothetical protein
LSTEAGVPLMHQPVDPHGIKQMVATWWYIWAVWLWSNTFQCKKCIVSWTVQATWEYALSCNMAALWACWDYFCWWRYMHAPLHFDWLTTLSTKELNSSSLVQFGQILYLECWRLTMLSCSCLLWCTLLLQTHGWLCWCVMHTAVGTCNRVYLLVAPRVSLMWTTLIIWKLLMVV